jgi:NAD(P)-dependent dehydrogenase (short-subunit alcohol dehydrogenase family)
MTTEDSFRGGVAVITGAGSGIGEGIARHAAALGMKLVLADIAVDRIERVAADIRAAGGEALTVPTDVRDPTALDRLAARTHEAFGPVRLLVNNAGIETLGFIWELSIERWEQTLDINIHGVIHGVRAFVPGMLESGQPAYIANLSSIGGLGMSPVQSAYILSKHAVLAFTECLSLEMQLLGKPIHVSAVMPGPVASRIFEDANGQDGPAIVVGHRKIMNEMLAEHGITPLEAGRIILDGIAAKQFFVSTHPEMTLRMARDRAHHLAELTAPELNDELRAILGR